MSYAPYTWQNGDTVTANKLNHMEQGIAAGGGYLVVNCTSSGGALVLDQTAGDIIDSLQNGVPVFVLSDEMESSDRLMFGMATIVQMEQIKSVSDMPGSIFVMFGTDYFEFSFDSLSDYPEHMKNRR